MTAGAVRSGTGAATKPRRARKARAENVLVFYKQVASAVESGLTVSRALNGALAEMDDPALREAVQDVLRRIDQGESLSAAMSKHPGCFSQLACAMVRAAERSGALAAALRVVEAVEYRALSVRRTIRGAMTYPALIVGASLLVVAVLLTVALPKFAEIFEQSGVQMPLLTRALMGAGRAARSYWWVAGPAAAGAAFAVLRWAGTPDGRARIDRALWGLPKIGAVVRKLHLSQASGTLAGLLRAGVPVIEALELVERTAQNTVLREALRVARESVARGLPLSRALAGTGKIPGMLVQLAVSGEETGALPKMLDDYAQIAREDAEVAVQSMLRLLEPAMLLMIGGMVAFIAASVYVPLSQLGNVVAGGAR